MKTVNLELSKQLKEAEYPQNTFAWWRGYGNSKRTAEYELFYPDSPLTGVDAIAAPTADEILDTLPKGCGLAKSRDEDKDNAYLCYISTSTFKRNKYYMIPNIWGSSATDVLAKMWLRLKKEKLI